MLEKSYAFADALNAARIPAHKGMRLGEIIAALKQASPETNVIFDFGGFAPSGIDSYRGYYSDLALSYRANKPITVAELLEILTGADDDVFEGYKGGTWKMNKTTPVWVANYGESHGVAVTAVDTGGYRVIIRTALIDE